VKTRARAVKKKIQTTQRFLRSVGKQKIFCIGQNKTGTTSLAHALIELGIPVAPTLHDHDRMMERVFRDWSRDEFRRIIRFCHSARAFKDYPFSLPRTFETLDQEFRGSKFVLTVRDTPEQWCNSFTNYYLKKYWNGKHPLSARKTATQSPYADFALQRMQMIYGYWEDPFDSEKLIQAYEAQNESVRSYFDNRPDDLIVINVSVSEDYMRLCSFLGASPVRTSFPWINRTST
jgi:hypothetical protein